MNRGPNLSLDDLKRAALAPLRFASRNDFAQLGRVQGLEGTLAASLERLRAACPQALARQAIEAMVAALPSSDAPLATRVQAFRALHQRLEAWPQPLDGPCVAAPEPAQPSPTPKAPSTSARPVGRVAPTAALPAAAGASSTSPSLTPEQPLQSLRGVGRRAAEQLATRELRSVSDLLHFLPRRFRARHAAQAMGELQADMVASVEGLVQGVQQRGLGGRRALEVVLHDGTGSVHLMWFRYPGRSFAEQFTRGARFAASGTVKRYRQFLQMAHPEIRRLEDVGELFEPATTPEADPAGQTEQEPAIVPLYLDVAGMHPNQLRRIVASALPALANWPDPLPEPLRAKRGLCKLGEALLHLHAPLTHPNGAVDAAGIEPLLAALEARSDPWHRRLIYDELFFLQLGLLKRRQDTSAQEAGRIIAPQPSLLAVAEQLLPFAATLGQRTALQHIDADLRSGRPMQRLLQGDVGSGKTAVALTAAYAAIQAGHQVALMAPTELLAEQHAHTASAWFGPRGVQTVLLTGQLAARGKREALGQLASGQPLLVVGTHALIQQEVRFGALAMAIVDEQHRFGVLQRARLSALGREGLGDVPHMLVMTATPIPRTLALTVYSDLDVSVLRELPPGRQPITTELFREAQRGQVYARVREQVAQGRQAFVVFPLVEESDKEGIQDVRAATQSAEELAQGPLKGLRLALLHGRLSAEEKNAVMQAFVGHTIDVLVATTVVEVGIDVGNATVMVIEHAERFGLSQLHQLRGRIGRGVHLSTCFLVARFRASGPAWRRLEILTETTDGFRIAEEDLAIRGPGDFLGTRQSGLPLLSLASLTRDASLLAEAREDARALLTADPTLADPAHAAIRARLGGLHGDKLSLVEVG